MVRVRSPLFWLTFLSGFFFAAAVTSLLSTTVSPSTALEIWIREDGVRNAYRSVFAVIAFLSLIGLVSSAVLEFRLARGWEPQWLTKFIPGCVVEGFTSRNHKPLVVLRKPDHQIFELELDKDELKLANVGDVVQVWYIGKYLAHMTPLEAGANQNLFQKVPPFSGYAKQVSGAWAIMISAPIVAGILCGKAMEHIVFREMTQSNKYEQWNSSPTEAAVVGWIMFLTGVGIAGSSAWKWLSGWDDAFMDQFFDTSRD